MITSSYNSVTSRLIALLLVRQELRSRFRARDWFLARLLKNDSFDHPAYLSIQCCMSSIPRLTTGPDAGGDVTVTERHVTMRLLWSSIHLELEWS